MFPANYVSRVSWLARRPDSITPLLPSQVDGIVFHYTAAGADEQELHVNCAKRVRGVQNFHMDIRGWSDLAYNMLVCKHGYVFEGRGLERKSAATGAANRHTLAVCFLGDDSATRDDLTPKGRAALVEVTRYIRKQRPLAQKLSGHRDFMQTSCPGQEIYDYIRSPVFQRQLEADDAARLATLRKWILARHAEGWSWPRIKATPNFREFIRRGGK